MEKASNSWIFDRLSERSTWLGLIGAVSLIFHNFKIIVSQEDLMNIVFGIVSFILVFTKDKK